MKNYHSSHTVRWTPQDILWQSEKCMCNTYFILEGEREKDWAAVKRVIFFLCWTTSLLTSDTVAITSSQDIIRYRESYRTQYDELCITETWEDEQRIPIFSPLNKYLWKPTQNGSSWLLEMLGFFLQCLFRSSFSRITRKQTLRNHLTYESNCTD